MISDRKLKQLAALSISDGRIDAGAADYALKKLSRSDLKRYLMFLRNVLRERQVRLRTPSVASADILNKMAALFPGKDIRHEISPALGAGLQIEYGDNIVNVNIRNMIEKTIRQLKEKT